MRRFVVVFIGLLVMGVFANQAFADHPTTPPPAGGGFIELCKAPNPALHGAFAFTVNDGVTTQTASITIDPAAVQCTQPIAVAAGSVTVTELGSLLGLASDGSVSSTPDTSYISATTTAVGPSGPLPSGTGFSYTTTVPASTGGSQNVVTVTYNNQLVTGVVEVCKSIVTGSGLTGSWQFTITGGNSFSQVVTVPAGNCSSPVTVPAGKVKVQETGDAAESVTAITATQNNGTADAVLSSDLSTGTVVAAVVAGDASKQTLVTMTNNSVRLKLCKYTDKGLSPTFAASYSFSFPTVTGNAGPAGPISPLSLTAGGSLATAVCTVVGTFRAGTTVQVVEGITPGTKVGSINVSPTTNVGGGATVVPGSLSLPNGTVTVVLGAGETVVTYEDIPALPGTLKICKVAGVSAPPVAPGTVFTFTVTPTAPAGGTPLTVKVPAGNCAVATSAPFDSTWSIVETAAPNTTVQSITAIPTNVSVLEGGVPTDTNQPVLSNVNLGGRSASVTIGESNTTEVTYVNIDPPAGSPGSGGGSSSSGGGVTSSGGASLPTTLTPLVPAPIPGAGGGVTVLGGKTSSGNSTATTKTMLLRAAKLTKLQHELTGIKVTLKKLTARYTAAKTLAAKHALAKQIAGLKTSQTILAAQIKLLKSLQ